MKLAKKLLSVFACVTVLAAATAAPTALSSLAESQTTDRCFDSGDNQNASYELDLAAQKNFYLTFKLKYTFASDNPEGWQGPFVQVRDGVSAKLAAGFIGNQGENFNGNWCEDAKGWAGKWLDVGLIVYENDLTILVEGEPVSGGIQVYTSSMEDKETPCKIVIGGATCSFQLDDIRVRDVVTTALQGGDGNHNWRPWIDTENLPDDYTLEFITALNTDDANGGFHLEAAKNDQNHYLNLDLSASKISAAVKNYNENGAVLVSEEKTLTAPATGRLTRYSMTLKGKSASFTVGDTTVTLTDDSLDPASMKRQLDSEVQIFPGSGWDWGEKYDWGGPIVRGVAVTAASDKYFEDFEVPVYTVTVAANPSAGGTVSGGATVNHGQPVTVTAVPGGEYTFTGWVNAQGEKVSEDAEYTFTPSADAALTAVFTKKGTYTVTLTADPADGGTVTGGGSVVQGQSATVKAVAGSGYTFAGWVNAQGETVSENPEYTFTPDADTVLTAKFEKVSFAEVDADFETEEDLNLFNNEKGLLSITADPQNASNKVLKFHASADNWGDALTAADNYDDFVLTSKILWSSESNGSGSFGLHSRLGAGNSEGSLVCELSAWKSRFAGQKADGLTNADYQDFALQADKWTHLKLVVKGNTAQLYLDGVLKAEYKDEFRLNEQGALSVGCWTDGDVIVYLDDLKIAPPQDKPDEPENKSFTEVKADFETEEDLQLFRDEKGLLSIVADPQKPSNKVLKFHASADNWGDALTAADNYDDFVLTSKILWSSESNGSGSFGLHSRLGAGNSEGSLVCELSAWKSRFAGQKADGLTNADYQDFALQADKWTHLKLVVKGNTAQLYLDGVLKAEYKDEFRLNEQGALSVGCWTDGDVVVYLDDLRIAHADSTSPATGESHPVLPWALAALTAAGTAALAATGLRRKKSAHG